MSIRRVALLTAGGFAPCLSAAVGDLIERYTEVAPEVEIIAYQYGYHGLLTGNYIVIDEEGRKNAGILREFGGSPIGNSRVKLTNAKNLVERGLVVEGVNPLEFAAEQLRKDGVDVLHTIGGDDTNTTAADLAAYLHEHDYELTVVGRWAPGPRPRRVLASPSTSSVSTVPTPACSSSTSAWAVTAATSRLRPPSATTSCWTPRSGLPRWA